MNSEDKNAINAHESHNEEKFTDEKTDLKIHQHLSDINDVISDQDIQNVRTDFAEETLDPSKTIDTQVDSENIFSSDEEKKTEEKKETHDKEDAHPIATPWNILGS